MKTLRTFLVILFLSGMMLTGCKKEEPVEPTKTEYCDVLYHDYNNKSKTIHNVEFTGTVKEIEEEKTKTITLMKAQGNHNISISHCGSGKHIH